MWHILFGILFICVGIVFLFLSALGVYRMPDVYNRLQTGTKAATLGAFCTIVGVGIVRPEWFWKTFAIAFFILLTNPVSSHAIGRASYRAGVRLTDKTVIDACKDEKNER